MGSKTQGNTYSSGLAYKQAVFPGKTDLIASGKLSQYIKILAFPEGPLDQAPSLDFSPGPQAGCQVLVS
jgi:hypothetical protein